MHEVSPALHTAEVVHWIALVVMAIVYTVKIRWLLSFNLGKDKSAPGNPGQSNKQRGARYSLWNVAMPWSMESTRKPKGFIFYISFVIFHLGVVAGISLAFVSTIAPDFLRIPVVGNTTLVFLVAAFLVSVYRILRRTLRPLMRLISTPDDYFSLVMLTIWFGLGACTQAYLMGVWGMTNETLLVAYLYLTSFFLLYVPFSKISHYLYYPFTRTYIGRALGHRGSYPVVRG
jgi:cell shape-determining protein MreD